MSLDLFKFGLARNMIKTKELFCWIQQAYPSRIVRVQSIFVWSIKITLFCNICYLILFLKIVIIILSKINLHNLFLGFL